MNAQRRARYAWIGVGGWLIAAAAISPARAQPIDAVVNGEALVRLQGGASIGVFNASMHSQTLESLASRNIHLVRILGGQDAESWKNQAEVRSDVVWVELNYFGQAPESRGQCFYSQATPLPDSYLNQQAWAQIELPAAQAVSSGAGVVVAIVDTGVDASHVALAGRVLVSGWNFVDSNANTLDLGDNLDNDGDGRIDEMTGHGTHAAGIVAMVAPSASILPIRVCDSDGWSTNFRVAQGIFYAIDQGADVVNVSVGSTYNSQGVIDAVAEALQSGATVAAAGGNMDTHWPPEYPALNAGVLGVASVDAQDVKTYFSNWHEGFSVSGPGLQIVSTLPGGLYAAWDGTSMSTPMAAAAAALVLARHPEWPRDATRVNNTRVAIMQSAESTDAANPQYAGQLGVGRLNAAGALESRETFESAVHYDVGAAPEPVTVGDFSGDSQPDIAVGASDASTVSILLNAGGGVLAPAANYSVASGPAALAAADLDGDDDIDLLVLCSDAGVVQLLRGHGDGSFAAATVVASTPEPRGMIAANLVGSALADLVVTDEDNNALRIYRNTGAAAFVLHATAPAGGRPYDVAAFDVEHDGDPDLICVNRDGDSISVLRNDGWGVFAAPVHYGVGSNPRAMAVADFDGDSFIDVAAANHESLDITIAWNNGAGAFNTTQTLQIGDDRRPEQLAAADVDCDGAADLAATSGDLGVNAATVFLSRAGRTFLRGIDFPVGAEPFGLIARDLDGDGDAELAVANSGSSTLSVLKNRACDQPRLGDMNCDGVVSFGDIDPFVLALSGAGAYHAAHPSCAWLLADANLDGVVGFSDIDPFVALLSAAP